MENTVLIQLTNQKALKLLQELEELHLIKVLRKDIIPMPNHPKSIEVLSAKKKDKS